DFAAGLKKIMTELDVIIKFGDGISEINPYAKAAWKILTFVYEAVKKQQDADDKILQLVQTMVEVYSFVEDVESQFLSQKIQRLQKVVAEIIKQTLECAIFIREYTGHGFRGRLIQNTLSDMSQEINGLSAAFLKLKDSFDRGLAFQSVFFSAAVKTDTEYLVQTEKLRSLNPVDLDASLRSMCLPGTRQDILTEIIEWVMTPSESGNIFWLHGVAGSGKSTISTTISQSLRGRLGAFLFFDRNSPASSSPGGVIRTLAYWMAMTNAHIRAAICQAITEDATLATAPLQTQFHKLLLEPLGVAQDHIMGPIIVIIDALDECGDPDSRQRLVSLIVHEFPRLPSVFRFLITSRPNSDIAGPFRTQALITPMQLNIHDPKTREDILLFFRQSIQTIRENEGLNADWPGEEIIQTLTNYSGGLFIWASTSCKFIEGFDPKKRLAKLLALDHNPTNSLDELYTRALQNSANWEDESFLTAALSVLGAVVLCRIPPTDKIIDKLLGLDYGQSAKVLKYLSCVVQWSPDQPARILHASFHDFLIDHRRSGHNPWFVDWKAQSKSLALGCFRVLNSQLRFNICDLEDSHILNVDIPDLSSRIAEHISAELKYGCIFWSSHLFWSQHPQYGGIDNDVLFELKDLLSHRFLHWLEVLSLLKQVPIATESLKITWKCMEVCDQSILTMNPDSISQQTDGAFQNYLQDAIRFLGGFSPVIAESAPHIYISALPFAPRESLVRKQFASSFSQGLRFTGPLGDHWSPILKLFHVHSWVEAVAFSSDGKHIVSASHDQMLRVWDSETGHIVACFRARKQPTSVAFLPDGRGVMASVLVHTEDFVYGITELWDSLTGELALRPFYEENNSVSYVAFSLDGKRIASGLADGTIRVWDKEAGSLIAGPLKGHLDRIYCIAFSPDGKSIVSGSKDATIRIWDSETGSIVTGPLKGHERGITSVAFSPNGGQIVSTDWGVRIWDSKTGSLVAGPFEGHGGYWVSSVDFSPDGKRIVSASADETIRVWDAQIGLLPENDKTFVGLRKYVQSVFFSHDGLHLVSGSLDDKVGIWDSETGVPSMEPFEGHTDSITSVAFSPDGTRIVSGSGDKTLRVWDSKTGTTLAGPFEGHTDRIYSVAFSPNGKQVVS
ncbi:hypothetical protein GGX14DRAFT_594255, partial [Mycena pura]